MSLQIECLAPVIPLNGHNASTSTSSLSSLLSPDASPSSPFPSHSRWMFFFSPHTFSHVSRWLFLHQRIADKVFFSRCLYPELLFIFMLLSVYWFLSVFECHYTCGHQGYRSRGVFCLSSLWIDFTPLEHIRIQQTDSPTWLMKGNTAQACKDIELCCALTLF